MGIYVIDYLILIFFSDCLHCNCHFGHFTVIFIVIIDCRLDDVLWMFCVIMGCHFSNTLWNCIVTDRGVTLTVYCGFPCGKHLSPCATFLQWFIISIVCSTVIQYIHRKKFFKKKRPGHIFLHIDYPFKEFHY
jgi:hypothetical protein